MDAAAEIGQNAVSKYQIHPEYRDEQAEAGLDGRTRLARPNKLIGASGDKEISIFHAQLTMSRIDNLYPVDLLHCYIYIYMGWLYIHTYIHTYHYVTHGPPLACPCLGWAEVRLRS